MSERLLVGERGLTGAHNLLTALNDVIEAAVARANAPLVDRIQKLTEALERQPGERLTQADLARMFGLTPSAMSMRLRRARCALSKLPFTTDEDGRKSWSRSDATALLARGAR